MKNSQMVLVEKYIRDNGYISRNWCIRKFITRLSAIIFILKEKGYSFETKKIGATNGAVGDFIYTATEMPKKPTYEKE